MDEEQKTRRIPIYPANVADATFFVTRAGTEWTRKAFDSVPQLSLTYQGRATLRARDYQNIDSKWEGFGDEFVHLTVSPSSLGAGVSALEIEVLVLETDDEAIRAICASLSIPQHVFQFLQDASLDSGDIQIDWSSTDENRDSKEIELSAYELSPPLKWAKAPLSLAKYRVTGTMYSAPPIEGNITVDKSRRCEQQHDEERPLTPSLWMLFENNKTKIDGTFNSTLLELFQALEQRSPGKSWSSLYSEGTFCLFWLRKVRRSFLSWMKLSEEEVRKITTASESEFNEWAAQLSKDEKSKAEMARSSMWEAWVYDLEKSNFLADVQVHDFYTHLAAPLLNKKIPFTRRAVSNVTALLTLAQTINVGLQSFSNSSSQTEEAKLANLLQARKERHESPWTTLWSYLWRLVLAWFAFLASSGEHIVFWVVFFSLLALRVASKTNAHQNRSNSQAENCHAAMLETYRHMEAGKTAKTCLEFAYAAERDGAVWSSSVIRLLTQMSDEGLSFYQK